MVKNLLVISALLLSGCVTNRTGIFHDYVIGQALRDCQNHEGPHYIVEHTTVKTSDSDKPCSVSRVISCQDGTKILVKDETSFCFIREAQIQESLEALK